VVAEQICLTIARLPLEHQHSTVHITTSVGFACAVPTSADNACAQQLRQHADLALYRAKHDGRNRWHGHWQPPRLAGSEHR